MGFIRLHVVILEPVSMSKQAERNGQFKEKIHCVLVQRQKISELVELQKFIFHSILQKGTQWASSGVDVCAADTSG